MSFVVYQDDLLSLPNEAGELYLPNQVPRLSTPPSPIVFLREYVMPNLPVVIEDGVKHWPALNKWSKDYLRNKLGEKSVTVTTTPNGYADAPVGDQFILPDEQVMKFKEFLTKLDANVDDEVVYIQKQNSSFTDEFSELMPDAEPHIPWASEAFGKLPDAVNFWMGSSSSITSMHKDHYENMYAVVRGSKTFILHPPSDLPCIPYELYTVCRYKKDDDTGKYVIKEELNEEHSEECGENGFNFDIESERIHVSGLDSLVENSCIDDKNSSNDRVSCENTDKNSSNLGRIDVTQLASDLKNINVYNDIVMSNGFEEVGEEKPYASTNCSCSCPVTSSTVPWIAIDPLNPDYKKYPLYRHANQLQVTVNPGDLFYLPSLWFHHVEQDDDTIAVNFWYDMEYDIKYNYYKFVENIVHKNMKYAEK